jgi:hypothetical protein
MAAFFNNKSDTPLLINDLFLDLRQQSGEEIDFMGEECLLWAARHCHGQQ